MSGVSTRFRDMIRDAVPWWLSDRPGKNVGYRVLWSMIAPLDAAVETLLEGLRAPMPGQGTPTALSAIGRTRGILRGYGSSETDESYIARLLAWLDTWRLAGSQLAIASQLHAYMSNRPRVTVVNRAGTWTCVAQDGTITTGTMAWDWDSVSNPERSGFWSEQWVIVYPDPWAHAPIRGSGLRTRGGETGIGHLCSREEYDAVKNLCATWKAAHTFIRTIIFTTDGTLFDPGTPASLPDGTWGQWSLPGSDPRAAGGRNTTTCRYWEP